MKVASAWSMASARRSSGQVLCCLHERRAPAVCLQDRLLPLSAASLQIRSALRTIARSASWAGLQNSLLVSSSGLLLRTSLLNQIQASTSTRSSFELRAWPKLSFRSELSNEQFWAEGMASRQIAKRALLLGLQHKQISLSRQPPCLASLQPHSTSWSRVYWTGDQYRILGWWSTRC